MPYIDRPSASKAYLATDETRKDPYEIQTVNGTKFLFLKWVNGDMLYRGQPAYYYVFTQ